MTGSRIDYPRDCTAEDIFSAFLEYFRSSGYHIEEADAVALRLHAEKNTGLLGSLFGIGTLHVRIFWKPRESHVIVNVSSSGQAARIIGELGEVVSGCLPSPRRDSPPGPGQVIIREIVKIPCRYCGSLMENTQSRCPWCGGE